MAPKFVRFSAGKHLKRNVHYRFAGRFCMYGDAHNLRFLFLGISPIRNAPKRILALDLHLPRTQRALSIRDCPVWRSSQYVPVAAVPSLAWIEAERSDKALAIMFLSYSSERRWRHMATVEVGCHVTNFAQLIQDDTLEFQVEPAGKSPPGVQWFLLFMDFSAGERRAARTTWAVLTALKRSADDGFIVGFRVVYGRHWLSLGSSSDTGEHATSRNVPAARRQSLEYPSEEGMACAR